MREKMGFIDRAWLRMESRENPMVITAVLLFHDGFPLPDLHTMVRERLATHARFRSRAVQRGPLGLASSWEEIERFDPAPHVESVRAAADDETLRVLVSHAMGRPLDLGAPPWRFLHVDRGAAGVALVVQIHHAIGDGVSLMRTLIDVASSAAPQRPAAGVRLPATARALRARVRRAVADGRALARLLALAHEPHTPLRPAPSGDKHIAWTPPLSLARLQAAAHARGGATLTDLVLAALAHALEEEHLAATGQHLERARALVPVFVHGGAHRSENRFGLVFLPLPLAARTAGARVRDVDRRLRALKAAQDTEVALLVLGGMGLLPNALERAGIAIFTGKASLLLTSVPGPAGAVSLAGHPLTGLIVSAPVAGTIGMSISMVSHGDALRIAVATDRALPHDPVRLVQRLAGELEALTASGAA